LTNGITYRFELIAEDRSGNKSKPSPAAFVTPFAAPIKLVSSTPANKAKGVNTNLAFFTFNFNVSIQRDSLQINCTFVANNASTQCGAQGSGFFGTPTWSNNDKTATFARLGGALVPGTQYRMEILNANAPGLRFTLSNVSVTFNTATVTFPKLVSSTPANNAMNVSVNTNVVLKFSQAIQKDSLRFAYSCRIGATNCPGFDRPVWSDGDKTATLKSTQKLETCKGYTFNISAKNQAGQELPSTSLSFGTAPPPGKQCT
jgi:methionine-rich copper-binding protein CopC